MYPGITDLLNDLFGTSFTHSFPPTFGTLVAISFVLAAWTLKMELKRAENEGRILPSKKFVREGMASPLSEYIWNTIFGFLLGYKLGLIFENSDAFFLDPQGAILSAKGNFAGGLFGAIIFLVIKYRESAKEQKKKARTVELQVYPHQLVPEITMAAALGGLFGAKLFHMFEYWNDFIADPVGMFVSGSGLTMYGGLIVGAASTLWYTNKLGIKPLQMCDAAAPGLMLAYGSGRLGCQLSGDGDWGIVNNNPMPEWMSFLPDWIWSYKYPNNVINEGVPIPGCEGRFCFELAEAVYPTPLYECIACIALFFVLWSMRKRISVPGVLFSWYLIFNGIERFLIEGIRVNAKYYLAGISFSQAQVISILLLITGVAGLIYLSRKKSLVKA
ncbi:MAG: diacylglyceryl transferase [Bacteroidetes bacterium]|mgnify:CR=1 FL=1|nr:MAG: diacylglyceryl transferase [Bacteroidota bacterium]REJ99905.1 MAG: diacylglyceryl transferase [Bacteroidota bacterium]REK34278.1 MAG: diacylglyceryl transferase [Bacteroidota bacterium]REK50608.1 MAG: diacylglyceryl transferase [Bacteroidota bacterium]